jgi:hypothetical protein
MGRGNLFRSCLKNNSQYGGVLSICHSRAGGNPGGFKLDSRLRGSDNYFVTYL